MDEETRAELEELRKRDRMRNWVSVIFVLAIIAGFRLLTMLACVLWGAYLVYCIRNSTDRGLRITYTIVLALPVIIFFFNLIKLITG